MLENIEISQLPEKVEEQGRRINLLISIDPGSTEIRGTVIRYEDREINREPKIYVEEAAFYKGDYDEDYTRLKVLTTQMRDHLYIKLGTTTDKKFSVLKGELARLAGSDKTSSSSKSKIEQDATIANIHSMIIQLIIAYSIENGIDLSGSTDINVYLNLALPTDETDDSMIKLIMEKFENVFEAVMPALDRKYTYTILKENIFIQSEVNATAMIYTIEKKLGDLVGEDKYTEEIIASTGGRSHSMVLVTDGKLNLNKSLDKAYGGENIYNLIIDEIAKATGKEKIDKRRARIALEEGYIKIGIDKVDVTEYVNEAKRKAADKIVTYLVDCWNMTERRIDELQRVVLSGRIYGTSEQIENGVKSISIADYIQEILAEKWGSHISVVIYNRKYPIPVGISYLREYLHR